MAWDGAHVPRQQLIDVVHGVICDEADDVAHVGVRIEAIQLGGADQAVDRGGIRAADIYTLIITAKLNNVDPRAWLADILRRIADQPDRDLANLLPRI